MDFAVSLVILIAIGTIAGKLNSAARTPFTVAVFLVIGLVGWNYLEKSPLVAPASRAEAEGGILGGPVPYTDSRASGLVVIDEATLEGRPSLSDSLSESQPTRSDLRGSAGFLIGNIHDSPAPALADLKSDSIGLEGDSADDNGKEVKRAHLPNIPGYFVLPVEGLRGPLHFNNAVDIANSCGSSVAASADGLVIDGAASGWNGGYGSFLLVEHQNGTKTRYAHLSELLVGIGNNVKQNQEIGKIGNTGHVQGVPGCHLHFEILGARNPFAH